jgi:catechol 2,3-dioxygenase-like lactoylglutathione lyase family enzyme
MRNIPQPRPAERLSERRGAAPPGGPSVTDHGSDVNGQAMGMMLVVSDLNRSLRFYSDLVGFSLVDRGANVAVLAYGGGRVLLRQLADMSPVDPRVAHLHISVSDVDASYKDLKDRGIEFVHRPRVTSRGEKLDLWAATFRDPDGHDVALTQWRAREDAPPQA